MAHNLMERNGKTAMFCVGDRDAAWHRLGQRTPNAVTWREAMELADLNWTVSKVQLFGGIDGQRNPVDAYGIFREDDGKFLGSVGARYTPIQNHQHFRQLDTIVESIDGAHYDSAGALGNGEVIWCSAKVPFDFEVVAGDALQTYLLGTTAHDGSRSSITKLTTTRVVCQNTLNSALENAGECLRVKHTRTAPERMIRQAELMRGIGSNVTALQTKLRRLADVRLTREAMVSVLDRLFPKAKDEKANQTRRENMLTEVLGLYESNDGNAFPQVRGTAYNLLNAITEYSDHFRTSRGGGETEQEVATARASSAMFGSGDSLKTDALELLLEESNSLPLMAL
jgi:phage/plasmid-like protein (TIGR03299 family)